MKRRGTDFRYIKISRAVTENLKILIYKIYSVSAHSSLCTFSTNLHRGFLVVLKDHYGTYSLSF